MLKRIPFIEPMVPTLVKTAPAGAEWLHEVKFDGFRAQVHVEGADVTIYSRKGADLMKRFRALKPALDALPARSAIIDCELVACDESGMPCFRSLINHRTTKAPVCLWAFDLLYLDGVRIMPLKLTERRERLAELIAAADNEHIQFSQSFGDPEKLLATAERMGLEGIVSKRRDSVYRPGRSHHWVKVKTGAWHAANKDRGELFEQKRNQES